jgi:two-component system LytT family response regulator
MPPLYTLVADGDPTSLHALSALLDRAPGVSVVGGCGTSVGVGRALRAAPADLLVLDARLGPDGGRAALDRLGAEAPPAVVLTSAGPADALWAYAAGVVDCLPSPVTAERLAVAVGRARDRVLAAEVRAHRDRLLALLDGEDGQATEPAGRPARPLVIRSGGQLIFLDPAEIDWIEASGVYVCVHVGGKEYLVRETLRHVEERLDGRRFLRIHRSTVLNVDRVRKIVPHLNGGAQVVLKDGTRLKMSRSYRERVSASLG